MAVASKLRADDLQPLKYNNPGLTDLIVNSASADWYRSIEDRDGKTVLVHGLTVRAATRIHVLSADPRKGLFPCDG